MKITNLTPHALSVVAGGESVTIPPSGEIARVSVEREQVGTLSVEGVEVPLNRTVFGPVEGLPAPQQDTIFIVSSLVQAAVPERTDVLSPDELIRDEEGRVVGLTSFKVM